MSTESRLDHALSNIATRGAGYGLLGRGDGSGIIVADVSNRLVYYRDAANQPVSTVRLLHTINILPLIGVRIGLEGTRVELGYPRQQPDKLHIISIDYEAGKQSVGGVTPEEQLLSKAMYPDIGSIINLRLSPNAPIDNEAYINPGWYTDASGNPAWWPGDTTNGLLATAIAALSSGEHQMAVVYINNATGVLAIATNTAEAGGADDMQVFDTTTIMSITYPAGSVLCGAVHLYEGRTLNTEDDIYRASDPRSIFNATGTSSGAPADATYIVQVADAGLPNAQDLDSLTDNAILKKTAGGVIDEAVAGTDYITPAGAENLSNKTITASSLIATALSLLIGGFRAIFTHANSADRTYTLPNASGTVALTSDITNPPFVDTQTIIKGSADATKLLRFEVDGFTTGVTRVLTPPDADAEIVGRTTTQTLTGKTIDGDDNTLQDIPLTAIKTNAANTKRFVWRNASGVITDAIQPSFLNATHDHTAPAEGGQLPLSALLQDGAATGQFAKWNGTFWQPNDLPNLIAILRDEKTSGTHGGTSATTTWNARDLNTELYDPGSVVSISSNQFTPIAGDYIIDVRTPFLGGSAASSSGRCRLYNVTAATVVEEGENTFALTNGAATAQLTCSFTANGTDVYRIDTYTSVGRATNGLGAQLGLGTPEVYTSVMLRKVA